MFSVLFILTFYGLVLLGMFKLLQWFVRVASEGAKPAIASTSSKSVFTQPLLRGRCSCCAQPMTADATHCSTCGTKIAGI